MCALFNDVTQDEGADASRAFVAMGTRIAEQSEFPPEMRENLTLPMMLMGWNDHYQVNHRGGTLEPVVPKQVSETEFELHLPGDGYPYPYDITYGMVFGFCRMLLPDGQKYRVAFDDPQAVYNNWQNGVILRITW